MRYPCDTCPGSVLEYHCPEFYGQACLLLVKYCESLENKPCTTNTHIVEPVTDTGTR